MSASRRLLFRSRCLNSPKTAWERGSCPDYARNVTEQSQLDLLEVVKISGFVNRAKGLGRPTKKEGRQLAEFADSVGDDGWDFDSDDFEGFDD